MSTPSERLADARKKRKEIAEYSKALKEGTFPLLWVLRGHHRRVLGRCSVQYILSHVPGLGRTGASKVLLKSRIWGTKPINRLTEEEIDRIWVNLPPRVRTKQVNLEP